jgi:transcriptional regulator with XRE-family HTH domain
MPVRARSGTGRRTAGRGRRADSLCRPLRTALGLSVRDFARLTGFSERSITAWESGRPMTEPARRKLTEVRRFHDSLTGLVDPAAVPGWLQAPNSAFGGLKPLEVIERGEIDRLWRMIYRLEAGEPI